MDEGYQGTIKVGHWDLFVNSFFVNKMMPFATNLGPLTVQYVRIAHVVYTWSTVHPELGYLYL